MCVCVCVWMGVSVRVQVCTGWRRRVSFHFCFTLRLNIYPRPHPRLNVHSTPADLPDSFVSSRLCFCMYSSYTRACVVVGQPRAAHQTLLKNVSLRDQKKTEKEWLTLYGESVDFPLHAWEPNFLFSAKVRSDAITVDSMFTFAEISWNRVDTVTKCLRRKDTQMSGQINKVKAACAVGIRPPRKRSTQNRRKKTADYAPKLNPCKVNLRIFFLHLIPHNFLSSPQSRRLNARTILHREARLLK